jgi:FkbM family methyltransferase
MKRLLNKALGKLGYALTRKNEIAKNTLNKAKVRDLDFLVAMPRAQCGQLISAMDESQAQLRQDLFVLSELGFKRGGYFVEFGAASGKELSNTWLLEKHFGWSGILAEPAMCWHASLAANRGCHIEHDCVWKATGERLEFLETEAAELATIADYQAVDMHAKSRVSAKRYFVNTVSLGDLLVRHRAPSELDYLSIDTEGSEYEILRDFDFRRFPFKVITCEHNHTPARAKIFDLLTRAGYVRKHERLSDFDDWYVKA